MMDLSFRDVKAVGKTCQRLSFICETMLESKMKVVQIRALWRNPTHGIPYHPPIEALLSAASLARQGFLTEVKLMRLGSRLGEKVDLSSIPIDDLVKLSKCVSDGVKFENVSGDLSPVLNNINCDFVQFEKEKKSLTTAESQALVTAMVSRVKTVRLTLDLEVLTQYNGKGKCDRIELTSVTIDYGDKMEEWALKVGWQIQEKSKGQHYVEKELRRTR